MPASDDSQTREAESRKSWTGGAVAVGLLLVLLPSAALYFGIERIERLPGAGLPVVALFGIMVLVGTLALTSTLFRRLGLAWAKEPLALPPGSVRATIALALIVLFAIIAVSVQHPTSKSYELSGLTLEAKNDILRDAKFEVHGVVSDPCTSSPPVEQNILVVPGWTPTAAPCSRTDQRFSMTVQPLPSASSLDLAKQLLGLIGNLMTMAVSFYFASRLGAKSNKDAAPGPASSPDPSPAPSQSPSPVAASAPAGAPSLATPAIASASLAPVAPPSAGLQTGDHVDGCNVGVTVPTLDHELPAAQGGVVPK